MNSTSAFDPTYYGFIGSTYDALVLFEACIAGQIKHVSRRPHDIERERVIQSGSIFVYEETTSGIKRWTDGISWSPSRILGNFLIYRQLAKAFRPGEKKKAIKKPKAGPSGITKNNTENVSRNNEKTLQAANGSGGTYGLLGNIKLETERALIGSLTDSYDFLQNGLVKKTISINYGDVTHHLVSYYTISDAINQAFIVPSKDPRLASTYPRTALLSSQNFRNAIGDIDPLDFPTYPRSRYGMSQQSLLQRPPPMMLALGSSSSDTGAITKLYSSDSNMSTPLAAFERDIPAYASMIASANQNITVFGIYRAPQTPEYRLGDYKQNSVAAYSFKTEDNRSSISTAGHIERELSFLHRRDSEDSGISISMDKMMNNSTISHNQNSVYGFPRGFILANTSFPVQKALPNSPQADFTHKAVYEGLLSNGQKLPYTISPDNTDTWQAGNASVGHGHYQNA